MTDFAPKLGTKKLGKHVQCTLYNTTVKHTFLCIETYKLVECTMWWKSPFNTWQFELDSIKSVAVDGINSVAVDSINSVAVDSINSVAVDSG